MTSPSAAQPPPEPAWPRIFYAWYVVCLLTAIYALAILDRVSLALLIQPLQQAFKINDMQFGLLQGMAFSIVYSLLGLPYGLLADRSNRARILVGGLTIWSLATIGCGFAHSFGQLFAARMLVGVGEAALVPVATSLIADYFPPAIRPKAFGVFVSGSSFGGGIALALGGLFLYLAGSLITGLPNVFGAMAPWQIVLLLCGTPGLILAATALLTVREPMRHGLAAPATRPSFRPVLALLAGKPAAFGSLLGGVVLNLVCVYAIIGWFPALFIRLHHWSAPQAGWILGAVGLPISLFAAMNSGWVMAWLTKRGHSDAPMLAATATSLSFVVFGGGACIIRSDAAAIAAYALMTFFVNWNLSAVYSGISQITPNELRGQVTAVLNIASGLVALTAGNFLVGFLSDTVFTQPDGISPSLALTFAGCGLASAAVLLSGRRAFREAAFQFEKESFACL
jgi:MFS family permease